MVEPKVASSALEAGLRAEFATHLGRRLKANPNWRHCETDDSIGEAIQEARKSADRVADILVGKDG